jgi:dihydrolipoamide dehydrogenase
MNILTGAGVESLTADAKGVAAKIKTADAKVAEHRFSHAIVAVGIVPNTENIGLEALKVETDRGFLKTDPMCRTNVKGLWAIGDITAPPWLAHKASHEGVIAAEAIAQELGNKDVHPHAMDPKNIPGCTYCRPQVASVGLTEAKAKEAGFDVKVGKFPSSAMARRSRSARPRASSRRCSTRKTGELLGAHMIGAEVTELIQGYTIGKTAELVETTSSRPSSRTRR